MESAFVIGQRAQQMALAGANPGPADQRELSLMVQEKQEAFSEAAVAAGFSAVRVSQQMSGLAARHIVSTSASMMSLMTSRTPAQYAARGSKLMRDSAANAAGAMSKLSDAGAKATRRSMKPLSKRVKQNVRRLVKR